MPGLFDWWYRLRRIAGPPGAPSIRAAVPSDVEAARLAELEPVFAHVDALEPELHAIEMRALQDADRLEAEAEQRIERIVADARTRAAVARADEAVRLRERHDRASQTVRLEAAAKVGRARSVAQDSIPALVERAVASVRDHARSSEGAGNP